MSSFNSSKLWHQDIGDYSDNVIVPKSLLIDTADAIRTKRDGSAAIDVVDGAIQNNAGIEPEDFATEISGIKTGFYYSDMFGTGKTVGWDYVNSNNNNNNENLYIWWLGDFRNIYTAGCVVQLDSSYSYVCKGYIYDITALQEYLTSGRSDGKIYLSNFNSNASGGNQITFQYSGSSINSSHPYILLNNATSSYGETDKTKAYTAPIYVGNTIQTGYHGMVFCRGFDKGMINLDMTPGVAS